MAFTPVDTPLQYQYKPLNLMAFAEPLMKMQEKYDLTKSAIEDSDVKATALQWAEDPEKARALEEVYRAKRDELVQNLIETKNYTQAGSKIKKLQKLWTEDPERVALEANYKLWDERNKAEIERVNKGEITKDDYLEWVDREKRKFTALGGTSYKQTADNPTGTYNPVTGQVGREKNLQEDLDKIKLDLAKAAPGEERAGVLQSLGLDALTGDAKFVQTVIEEKNANKVAENVERYLKTLDRFKPWLAETEDYKFDVLSQNPEAFNTTLMGLADNALRPINERIQELEKGKKTNTDEYRELVQNRQILQDSKTSGFDPELARNLFNYDFYNKKYSADEIAQVFAYKNVDNTYTFRDVPKPDSGGGDGGITADDLASGSFTPNKFLPILGDLNKQKITAGKGLYPQLAPINNIAGGNFRIINLGAPGSKNRKFLEADPGAQRQRQERIILLANNSKNATEFYNKLMQHGFKSGVTQAIANSVFSALQNKETKAYATTVLKQSEQNFNSYTGAQEQISALNKSVLKDKTYSSSIEALGSEKYSTSLETVAKLAKAWGKTLDQMIESGVVQEMESQGENGSYTTYYLSANNLAQVNGYKSLKDAVEKGASISQFNVGLGRDYNELTNSTMRKLNAGQVMSHTYVGDPKLDKAMNSLFTSVGNLEDFAPVETKDWANTLGFDAKGNLAPGTSFDFANGQSVKLVKHGNNIYYQIPLSVASEGGPIKRTILVKPKAGTEPKQEQILQYMIQNAQRNANDPTANQSYDMAVSSLYDLKNRSNITSVTANSYTVDAGDAPLVLETVSTGVPGTNLQIVKVAVPNKPDQYKVQVVNAAGTRQFVPTSDGKEFSSSNVEEAKIRAAELLYGY
jgi:uncharacterized protein (UPF0335 family)